MKRLYPVLIAMLALLSGVAMAQDATPVEQLFNSLLEPLLAAATAAVGYAVVQAGRLLGGRIALLGNVKLQRALETLNTLAFSKVYEIYQDAVEDIKLSAADGRLTLEEANAAFKTAQAELTASLPVWLRETLLSYAGGSVGDMQKRFLSPAIETAVTQMPMPTSVIYDDEDDESIRNLEVRKADSYARLGITRRGKLS